MSLFEKSNSTETGHSYDSAEGSTGPSCAADENAVPREAFTSGNSLYAGLQRVAGRLGVEQRGIERVPEEEKTDTNMSHAGTLWLSANMVVSSFAIGVLAIPVFGLDFVESALVILFVNVLGVLPVCFFATFGPKFGLRQVVLSRFYFGYHGVRLIALFNILACVGWSAVNAVVGAQLFQALAPRMPGWAGIVAVAASTLVVTVFGYRVVHAYERFAWIPCLVVFLVVLGLFARSGHFDARARIMAPTPTPTPTPQSNPDPDPSYTAAAVLSFAASVFGFATGWCSLAADYTVYVPASTGRGRVFAWTMAGLLFPLWLTELLGAAVATALAGPEPGYRAAYDGARVGGLLAHVLVPAAGRFGQFCLVVLALSIVAGNCPNSYSVSLSLEAAFGTGAAATTTATATTTTPRRWLPRVPRFVWVVLATAAYAAVAVVAYAHFESALESFMLVVGYWLAVYEGVALAEHTVFRRGLAGYDPDDYRDPTRLPPGLAGLAAFLLGAVGVALGMAQPWYVGPVGRACGGGDLGFELGFACAFVSYLGFRTLEKRYFGR